MIFFNLINYCFYYQFLINLIFKNQDFLIIHLLRLAQYFEKIFFYYFILEKFLNFNFHLKKNHFNHQILL